MLEQRICGVIRAERGAHGRDGDALRLAIVPDEWHHFLAQVGIEHRLHVASMKRVRAFVIKAEAVDGIDGKKLQLAAIDKIRERADHGLPLKFPLISRTGGKTKQWRAIVAVHHYPELHAQALRIPAMEFTFHIKAASSKIGGTESMPAPPIASNRAVVRTPTFANPMDRAA